MFTDLKTSLLITNGVTTMNLSLHITTISLFLLLFSSCQPAVEQSGTNESENTTDMLQHNVYFYLNDDVTTEERQQFEEGLKELVKIPEIHKAEIGTPAATEERDVTDHSFGYAIFTWFKTMEDYKVYAEHPDHLKFIDKYSQLWVDVKVYDSEIIGNSVN